MHRISEKIISWQIRKGKLRGSERNKYVYAYEILLNQLVNMFIAIVLALVFHELIAVLVFLVIYIPLRKYAGGFHAKSNEKCMICSSVVIVCVIVLNKVLHYVMNNWESFSIIWFILVLAYVWRMAPIETPNKKLDEVERRTYKRKVHFICIVHMMLMVLNVLVLKGTCIPINMLLAYTTSSLLLVIEYKRKK